MKMIQIYNLEFAGFSKLFDNVSDAQRWFVDRPLGNDSRALYPNSRASHCVQRCSGPVFAAISLQGILPISSYSLAVSGSALSLDSHKTF